jgi:hypothetical protein
MLVKEHSFKFFAGGKIHSILVEEHISHGTKWHEKCRASVPISNFESRVFYASTPEAVAEQVVKYYLRRTSVRPIDQISLHQIQAREETG